MANKSAGSERRPGLSRLGLERLEDRVTPAYTLTNVGPALTITADAGDSSNLTVVHNTGTDQYVLSDVGGLVFNDTATGVVISGNATASITLNGALINSLNFDLGDQSDLVLLDSTTDPTTINVGTGDDILNAFGVPAGQTLVLVGGDGNDTINGSQGDDIIDGGAGNDTVVANKGSDTITLGDGDDTNTWNNGDGSDVIDGGVGNDTQVVNGAPAADAFTIAAGSVDPSRVNFQRTNLVPFTLDLGTVETLDLNTLGGDDTVEASTLLPGLIALDIDGGDGNDTINGSQGNDTITGGVGNDTVVANKGSDTITLGDGDDTNTWNNGDGSDVINGGVGNDTQVVNGAPAADAFTIAAGSVDPNRVAFARTNLVPFTLDIGTVETLDLNTLGGDDTVEASTLLPGLIALDIDGGDGNDTISGSQGNDTITGGVGNDTVVANKGSDTITLGDGDDTNTWNNGDGSDVINGGVGNDTQVVNGAPAADAFTIAAGSVDPNRVAFARTNLVPFTLDLGTVETLDLNTLGGDDTVEASTLLPGLIALDIDGGDGNDTISGSQGNDTITGGVGNDTVTANKGSDTITLGDGDDTNTWNNGDGSDVINGGVGNDTQVVNGAPAADAFTIAVGSVDPNRVAFARTNLVPFTLDIGTVETLDLNTLGGDDTVTASPSAVTAYDLDGGDGTDSLTVNGGGASGVVKTGPDATGSGNVTSNRQTITFSNFESAGLINTKPIGQTTVDTIAVGSGVGGGSTVTVRKADGTITQTINTPFSATEAPNGVRTASADVTGDGVADVIIGTGPGARTQVKVFDGKTGSLIQTILPFETAFTGGVFVAAGDIDGDGFSEVLVTPDEGGGPVVAIYSGKLLANGTAADATQLNRFFGIEDSAFRGGARVALGDVNGDGVADVLVAAGFGGGPRVALFDGKTALVTVPEGKVPPKLRGDFFVFEDTLRNGVFITSGDINGDGFSDVIVGGGPGGGPRVFGLSGKDIGTNITAPIVNFFAGDDTNRGGVRITVKDIDHDSFDDIVTASGTDTVPSVKSFAGLNAPTNGLPTLQGTFDPFDASFLGGVFVG